MNSFTIKPDKGRAVLFFFLISIFMAVGIGLLFLPPNKTSIIPLNQFLQPVIGCISALFGLVGYVTLFVRMQKPIIAFDEQEIRYYRNGVTVPWADIRSVQIVNEWGGNKVRWIYINVHNPEKYSAFEKLNKRYGMIEADLVFDFSLASQSDYEQVCKWVQERVH